MVERVVDQRRLARARHAGDADEQPDRQVERDVLAGCCRVAPVIVSMRSRVGRWRMRRHRDLPAPGEILAGQRMRRAADLLGRALRDDLAAVLAGARPHVDDVVGRQDRVLVVLDDDHAVAEVAQVLQRVEQPVVVALVQADRRLVEHVHHAGQARADLRREADALRLAAGQRFRRAVERQVVEADVVQELQPRLTISLTILSAIAAFWPSSFSARKNADASLERPAATPRRSRARRRPSPTLTWRASRRSRVPSHSGQGLLFRYFASSSRTISRIGLAIAPLEVRDDALEGVLARHRLAALGQVA